MELLQKDIMYCGEKAIIACDGNCNKAWGMNSRPRDSEGRYKKDIELDLAPSDPGTYEGGIGKPVMNSDKLNKWCCRECEMVDHIHKELILDKLPRFN